MKPMNEALQAFRKAKPRSIILGIQKLKKEVIIIYSRNGKTDKFRYIGEEL